MQSKIIQVCINRGFTSQASLLDKILGYPIQDNREQVVECPICGVDPESDCVLCDGTGVLSVLEDNDDEDLRVIKDLELNKKL